MKGILLVAAGKEIFSELAVTLALSIKHGCPSINISLAGSKACIGSIPEQQKKLFDKFIFIPESDYFINGQPHYGLLKTKLINYSPYQKTLFLDADTILYKDKNLNILFDELKDIDFTSQTFPFFILGSGIERQAWDIFWAPVKQIRKSYNIAGGLAQIHSYLLYFDNVKAKPLFDKAAEVYMQIITKKVKIERLLRWNGQIPDELCFCISSGLTNIFPHVGKYSPLAEPTFVNNLTDAELIKKYIGFTMPGKGDETYLLKCKRSYIELKKFYFDEFGLTPRFTNFKKK